jgi:hypothetical protein
MAHSRSRFYDPPAYPAIPRTPPAPPPPVVVTDFELREGGGRELREDGSFELRDAP